MRTIRCARALLGRGAAWEVGDDTDDVIGSCRPTAPVPDPVRAGPGTEGCANRLHLDLTTTSLEDQSETVERLLELGGRHIDIGQRPDEDHVVLADPEGNELCIIEPANNFLSDCGRFGSITCDGTREVGYFWSEALGWPLVWDQDEETAIRAPDLTGPMITWGGPPLNPKPGKNRLHLDIAPPPAATSRPRSSGSSRSGRAPRHRPGRRRLGGHGRSRRQRVLCPHRSIAPLVRRPLQ